MNMQNTPDASKSLWVWYDVWLKVLESMDPMTEAQQKIAKEVDWQAVVDPCLDAAQWIGNQP